MGTLYLPDGRIDLTRREVVRAGTSARLTPTEARLVDYLARQPGRDVSREELLVAVWGYAPNVASRACDRGISRLRQKIEADPSQPVVLQSTYGSGYRWQPPAGALPARLAEQLEQLLQTLPLAGLFVPDASAHAGLGKQLAERLDSVVVQSPTQLMQASSAGVIAIPDRIDAHWVRALVTRADTHPTSGCVLLSTHVAPSLSCPWLALVPRDDSLEDYWGSPGADHSATLRSISALDGGCSIAASALSASTIDRLVAHGELVRIDHIQGQRLYVPHGAPAPMHRAAAQRVQHMIERCEYVPRTDLERALEWATESGSDEEVTGLYVGLSDAFGRTSTRHASAAMDRVGHLDCVLVRRPLHLGIEAVGVDAALRELTELRVAPHLEAHRLRSVSGLCRRAGDLVRADEALWLAVQAAAACNLRARLSVWTWAAALGGAREPERTRELYERILELARSNLLWVDHALALRGLASWHANWGDLDLARQQLDMSLPRLGLAGLHKTVVASGCTRVELLLASGRVAAAREECAKWRAYAEVMEPEVLTSTELAHAQVCIAEGRFGPAVDVLTRLRGKPELAGFTDYLAAELAHARALRDQTAPRQAATRGLQQRRWAALSVYTKRDTPTTSS